MFYLVSYGYEFLTQAVPFAAVLLLMRKNCGKYSPAIKGCNLAILSAFALYIICVFHVTGAGTLYQALRGNFTRLGEQVNMIPFSRDIDAVGYTLNILMFVPFGLLVPLIWKRMANPGCILLAGLLMSLLIELSQLLGSRGTDVDDLIMNTLGALLGFLLYEAWIRVTGEKFQMDADPTQLPVYVLAMYLGRCLLFDYLGLLRLWYGY